MTGKKCCVLISGTIRLYDKYLIKFLSKLKSSNQNLECVDVILSLNSKNVEEEVIKNLNPKKVFCNEVVVEEKYFHVKKNEETNVYHTYSMYLNNHKAFQLLEEYQKENNIIYDFIVKYRSDLFSNDDLFLNETPNTLYIPDGNDYSGLNDQVAYGDFTAMKKYCSVYPNIENLIFNMKINYHPETILKNHIMTTDVNIKRFNYNYQIQRS